MEEDKSLSSFKWLAEAYAQGAIFTAFDIETTGLDPKLDKIVEIGAVKFDYRGPMARFSVLINPGIAMPPEVTKINNISDEMLAGKPFLHEILPDFLFFIKNTILTVHNAPFDCGFINEKLNEKPKNSRETGEFAWNPPFPALPNPIADTLVLSREAFPGLKSYSLQNLARELNIQALDAHRAEDDARVCMEILLQCLAPL